MAFDAAKRGMKILPRSFEVPLSWIRKTDYIMNGREYASHLLLHLRERRRRDRRMLGLCSQVIVH